MCEAIKTFETEFLKFYHKGSFFHKKTQKLLKDFPDLATLGRHNSAVITKSENSRLNLTGCLVSIFTVRINSNSFPWAVRCAREAHPPNLFAIRLHTYGIDNTAVLRYVMSPAFERTLIYRIVSYRYAVVTYTRSR